MNGQLEFDKEITRRLDSASIPYMLTDSMALVLYACPRVTLPPLSEAAEPPPEQGACTPESCAYGADNAFLSIVPKKVGVRISVLGRWVFIGPEIKKQNIDRRKKIFKQVRANGERPMKWP